VTGDLVPGENVLTITLATDRPDGGLRNPLYLAGDFGVRLNPPRLAPFSPAGGYEDWEANGLPYYAGVVEYETVFPLAEVPAAERVLLELDHGLPFQDAVEVSLNGGTWIAMPWSPYRAVVEGSALRAGENALRVRVYTTLIRPFEGAWWDIPGHVYRSVETGEVLADVSRRPREGQSAA